MNASVVLVPSVCAILLLSGCADLRRGMGASPASDRDVLTGGPVTGITLQELPEAVQQAVKREEPAAEVVDIHKTDVNGRAVYRISLVRAKGPPVLEIGEDGQVLTRGNS